MWRPSRGRRVWHAPLVREGNSLMLLAAAGPSPPRGGLPGAVRGAGTVLLGRPAIRRSAPVQERRDRSELPVDNFARIVDDFGDAGTASSADSHESAGHDRDSGNIVTRGACAQGN